MTRLSKKILLVSVLLNVMVFMFSAAFTVWKVEDSRGFYSVDLSKIISAEMLLAGRMSSQSQQKTPWMASIQDASQDIKKTIRKLAGHHPVVVAPAVIEGAIDITDRVLQQLGLPTHVPNLSIPQSAMFPKALSAWQVTSQKKNKILKKNIQDHEAASWLLP